MRETPFWRRYLRLLGSDPAADVEDELEFHFAMRVEDLMRRGMSEPDARAHAEREFGDVGTIRIEMEEIGNQRQQQEIRARWWDSLGQDLRYAARTLRRSPGFTAVAVLTLALGIGANTAIFSVVDSILIRSLPYPEADRLVAVWPEASLLGAEYTLIRDQSRSFEELALHRSSGFNLSGAGEPERLTGAYVSANLFATLAVPPLVGRTLLPGEDEPGRDDVVVLSHGLWQGHFGSDPEIVGRRISIDGEARTVVGVMPPAFHFPSRSTQLWVPWRLDPNDVPAFWGQVVGGGVARLRPDVTPEAANAELRSFIPELRAANPFRTPGDDYKADARITPLREALVGDLRPMLLVLLGAVGLVLLIACANVANLLLARGLARGRELAVRTALGATRRRLVRQLLTESLALALLGGVGGVLLALGVTRFMVVALPQDTPRLAEVAVDVRVLGFALAATLLTGLVFGLFPGWRASRLELQETLREADRGAGRGAARRRLSSALVVSELALAVVLVIGAGLLLKSFWRISQVDPGFVTERVVSARVSPPQSLYEDATRQRAFHQEVLERVAALPTVSSVAATSQLPFDQDFRGWALGPEGVTTVPDVLRLFDVRQVTPDFFEVLSIPLLRGRTFTEADVDGSLEVVIVDEALAQDYWPDENPIGKRIGRWGAQEWMTVVGVVGSVKNNDLTAAHAPDVYVPFLQHPRPTMTLVLRTDAAPDAVARSLRAVIDEVDPTVPISLVQPMEELVSDSLARPRLTTLLLSAFAAIALLLGAIGIYGVIAYAVQQRTREIGVRIALGGRASDVLMLVLRQGAALALLGVVLGVAGALAVTRVLESFLFEVERTDPATFVLVSLLLVGVALLASYLPASRATRVDPMEALRGD